MLSGLLSKLPEDRPSLQALRLLSVWFKGIDWQVLPAPAGRLPQRLPQHLPQLAAQR